MKSSPTSNLWNEPINRKEKKVTKKKNKTYYNCPHCGEEFDFPVAFCKVHNGHTHVIFMGLNDKPAHMGICAHCWRGETPVGRAWHTANGTVPVTRSC